MPTAPRLCENQGQNLHSIKTPWSKALDAPERRYNDTVPGVVGSQFSVVGCPAARDNPSFGILKAFGPAPCAHTSESSDAVTGRITRRMAQNVKARTLRVGSGQMGNVTIVVFFPPARKRTRLTEVKTNEKLY